MSILFCDIYSKAIALFNDPKITKAYETNTVQFDKLMYTFLQDSIAIFTNPSLIAMKLQNYKEPKGTMEIFDGDGESNSFELSESFEILDNSKYVYIENQSIVEGTLDKELRTITFPDVLPEGQQYAFEQYYVGEFTDNFGGTNRMVPGIDKLVKEEVKDILARLLVKTWSESQRNDLLDIRGLMTDGDFKLMGNDRILKSKDQWVAQLEDEVLRLQNKLAWNIRFMNSSKNLGRG